MVAPSLLVQEEQEEENLYYVPELPQVNSVLKLSVPRNSSRLNKPTEKYIPNISPNLSQNEEEKLSYPHTGVRATRPTS